MVDQATRLPAALVKELAVATFSSTGTIGIGRSLKETPGALGVVAKAALSVLYNVPYCLKHRQAVKAPDFELTQSDGKVVKLAELLKKSEVLLTFYRGGW